MEQNNYPLTLEHVKHYLATKQDDEPVGLCLNSMACLLAETLNYIYPQMKPWRVDMGSYCAHDMARSLDLEKELYHLALLFDHGGKFAFNNPIPKKAFRDMMIQNRMPLYLKAHLDVSSIFPEVQTV